MKPLQVVPEAEFLSSLRDALAGKGSPACFVRVTVQAFSGILWKILLQSRCVRRHSNVQMCQLSEHFPVFRFKPRGECRIVELGLAVGFAHVAHRVQALQDGLPPWPRQLLPAREE